MSRSARTEFEGLLLGQDRRRQCPEPFGRPPLLAHRDALVGFDGELVVLVDEAHELEGAATEALSAVFDYQALERVPAEIARFSAEADGHPAIARLVQTAGQLRRFLDAEVLPSSALRVLDQLSEPGSEPGRRAISLASPYVPIRGGAPIQALRHSLSRARNYLEFSRRMLSWWAADDNGLAAADRNSCDRHRNDCKGRRPRWSACSSPEILPLRSGRPRASPRGR